jgi:hypothetical protein
VQGTPGDETLRDSERIANRPGAFIVPFYGDQPNSVQYMDDVLAGFEAQTDRGWRAIIIDDATPPGPAKAHLDDVEHEMSERVMVIRLPVNAGHGHARNVGIRAAAEKGYPFILYNDADDISHPERVAVVRRIFAAEPRTALVYSTFTAIDEHGHLVPEEALVATNRDSLLVQRTNPISGKDAWLRIAFDPGSACLPSSTALRTSVALECPSPTETPSEDTAQWMHISASGGEFHYTPEIPSGYRMTSSVKGSTHHRRRMGERTFYERTVEVRTAGFLKALNTAKQRGTLPHSDEDALKSRFFLRLADNMAKVGWPEIAERVLRESALDGYNALAERVRVDGHPVSTS